MRVLLTGASRGIGRAIATRLARPGASLALCASSPSPELDSIAAGCAAKGAEVERLIGDLADKTVPSRLVGAAVARFGGLDAVVSNAGIVVPGSLADLQDDAWDRVFAVNVRSAWLLARAAYPHLRAAVGSFVSVASMSGIEPYPGTGAYSPSKGALIMLVRVLAQEWAADGIRVNTVSPGLIRTPLTESLYADPRILAGREAVVPLHRIGHVDDVARALVQLAGADFGYATGIDLKLDGGLCDRVLGAVPGVPANKQPSSSEEPPA